MSLPKKPQIDPQIKTAAAKSLLKVVKPMKVGTGRSRVNLFAKRELDEYARANPGPGLLQKIGNGIKGLLKKLTKGGS
jgi:hypothetical protein